MSRALQLHELIAVETPLGPGYAIIVDMAEHDYWWTVALDNGAIVTFQQRKIRVSRDYTHERGIGDAEMREIIKRPMRKKC